MEIPPAEVILFENAILNVQKFVPLLKKEMIISNEDESILIENMTMYSIIILDLFLLASWNYEYISEYDNLHTGIINQYKKFIWENSGANNEKDKEMYWRFIQDSMFRKMAFIGLCKFKDKVDKEKVVSTVVNDTQLKNLYEMSHYDIFRQHVAQLVDSIEWSVNHFKMSGII